jgi:hypothetical protein
VTAWRSAIAAILADPSLARRRREAGERVARSMSWERGATALRHVLSAVATGELTRAGYRALAPGVPVPYTPIPDAPVPDASAAARS